MFKDYYAILGVDANADFRELKRGYYRRAKECHPDRFQGSKDKEEEFKLLVEAFDVLSDPVRRRRYDPDYRITQAGAAVPYDFGDPEESIMDSVADDILEELIVGNDIPRRATLQTLMRDLANTEKFCLFREAKTCLYAGDLRRAAGLLNRAVQNTPNNILYRVTFAWCCRRIGKIDMAVEQLQAALHLGALRQPPQRLIRVRRELRDLQNRRQGRLRRWLGPKRDLLADPEETTEDRMQRQLSSTFRRLAEQAERNARKRLPRGDAQ